MADEYVRHTQDDYAQSLAALLPTGPAWPRDPDSIVMQFIDGLAGIWGNDVSGAADTFLTVESFPPTSVNLLPEWEESFGLPDDCLAEPLTIVDRHAALVQRMTIQGAQSRAFFIEAAASIGYTIQIREFSPWMFGVSRCGDTSGMLDNPDTPTQYRWEIGPPFIRYYWTINVNAVRVSYFHCASGQCGIDRLLTIGLATDLECLLRRWKPAHTEIIFDYSVSVGLDFSKPTNSGNLLLFGGF